MSRNTFFLASYSLYIVLLFCQRREANALLTNTKNISNMKTIETLNKNDFFKRKDGANKTFIVKGYCRTNKAYECQNWDDISDFIYLKKGKQVFTDFEF